MDNKPKVTLIDGRIVSSWSDEWRVECLARAIARMPTLHQRRQMMLNWQKKMPEQDFKNFAKLVANIFNSELSRVAK